MTFLSKIRTHYRVVANSDYDKKALDDYQAMRGKTVLLHTVSGYKNNDSVEVSLKPPKKFKIVETERSDILHYNDEWLDPYYNVEPLEAYPEIQGMRSFWCNGKSYNTKTGEVSQGDIKG